MDSKPRLGRASSFRQGGLTSTPTRDDKDEDGPEKGGHSLRKRARVNYATEQIEDEVVVPNSTSTTARAKKRKLDAFDDIEPVYGPRPKRRGVSVGADTPSTRRRNPSRKSTEIAAYREHAFDDNYDDDHDDDIQDTIEVGLSQTDSSDESIEDEEEADNEAKDEEKDDTQKVEHHLSSEQQAQTTDKAEPNSTATATINEAPAVSKPEEVVKPSGEQQLAQEEVQSTSDNQTKVDAEDQAVDPTKQLQDESAHSLNQAGDGIAPSSPTPSSPVSPKPIPLSPQITPTKVEGAPAAEPTPEPTNHGAAASTDDATKDEANVEQHQPPPASPEQPPETLPSIVEPTGPVDTKDNNIIEDSIHQLDKAQPTSDERPDSMKMEVEANPATNGNVATSEDAKPPAQHSEAEVQETLPINGEATAASPTPSLGPPSPAAVDQAPSEPVEESEPAAIATDNNAADNDNTVVAEESRSALVNSTSFTVNQNLGRWAHLAPFIEGEYTVYPEKAVRPDEDDAASEDQSQEDKDGSKDPNDVAAAGEDNDETPATGFATEDPTPAQNTPLRPSPTRDALEAAGPNSPLIPGEEPEDAESSESQEPPEKSKHYRYRKLNEPEQFINEIEKFADMNTADLYEMLDAVNDCLVSWEHEFVSLGKVIDDYENASRRRIADAKFEAKTRNLSQHGVSFEEPEFVVKGYKAKEKERLTETRYLQSQDRIMAAAYGFEYDPHPSKIGRQNPETQQAGITTRGRSLRNQPRQTAKATEADGVMGKRQRKPVQLFDPAPLEGSRSSTPVPTKGRRRKNAYADAEDAPVSFTSSFQGDFNSDVETTPSGRRKRATRGKAAAPRIVEDRAPTPALQYAQAQEEQTKTGGRRGRPKASKVEEVDSVRPSIESEPQPEPVPTRMLTLKIPKGTPLPGGPSSAITDNGESRPSTANSDSTAHTVESSYSLRPKRQKRFRDEPSDNEAVAEDQPKKKKRVILKKNSSPDELAGIDMPQGTLVPGLSQNGTQPSKPSKSKTAQQKEDQSRTGTPMSQPTTDGGDDQPKDYSTMTKSEKMSASMRSKHSVAT